MSYYIGGASYGDKYLAHYGVLGMKWGVRRYENPDGSLTEEGKKRYGAQGKYTYTSWATKRKANKANRLEKKAAKAKTEEKRQSLQSKADYNRKRAEKSQELDSRMEEYARSVSVGGNILSRMFSNVGSKGYAMTLAVMGGQNRDQPAKKIMAWGADNIGKYLLANIPYQMLLRGSYTKGGKIATRLQQKADRMQQAYDAADRLLR